MKDLGPRLQAVEDRLAIEDLIARYGPAVDAGDGARLAADWTEDAAYTGKDFAFTGRDSIAALTDFPTHQDFMAAGCAHVMGPHAIDIDGDSATARGTSLVVIHDAHTGLWQLRRASANLWHFRRKDGIWRISARVNRLLDGAQDARALLVPQGAD